MKKLWILLFAFLYADVVDRGITEAPPGELERDRKERIKRGFIPPMEKCSYENEDYWIKIVNTCRSSKDDGYCPSAIFIIDKKKDLISDTNSEAAVIATGHLIKSWRPNGNSYVFYSNDDFRYWITFHWKEDSDTPEDSTLRIETKQETEARYPYKTIYEKTLKSCNPNGKIP